MKKLTLVFTVALMAVFVLCGTSLPETPDFLSDNALAAAPLIAFGGLVVNAANLKTLFTNFSTAFDIGFRTSEAMWNKIATLVPATTKQMDYGWLGQWPRLREWIGDRVVKNLTLHDYTIKEKKYESTIGVDKDDIETDNVGVFTPLFQEMGYASQTHPDELVFDLLKNGFTNLCYDGQFFFDTDHPVGNEDTGVTSVSNMQAGGGNAWFLLDTRRPLKPLIFQRRKDYKLTSMTKDDDEKVFMSNEFRYGIDARLNVGYGFWQLAFGSKDTLDQPNFEANRAAMMAFKTDEGRPVGAMPDVLVVGPSNLAAAESVIKVSKLANGADNPLYNTVEILVSPWLD